MNKKICFECGAKGVPIHQHHVVPRSRGGTKTVPLCEPCHSKAHHRKKNMNTSSMVKEGIQKAKAKGVVFGNPNITKIQKTGVKKCKEYAKAYNIQIAKIIIDLQKEGYITTKEITNRLNELNIKTRRGQRFKEGNVYRLQTYARRLNHMPS